MSIADDYYRTLSRNADDKAADDERRAAERIGDIIGDGPLCPHCKSDSHTDPACPIKAHQEQAERERKERAREWERKTWGTRKRNR